MIGSVLTEKGKKMDDLISRQAATKHLKHRLYQTAMNNVDLAGVFSEIADNRIETWIEEVPSAQPVQWIPCSERLPKVGQDILMSVGGMYTAEGCLREDGDWAQFRWDTIQRKDMVGAWMPLPEPYKENSDGH